MFQSVKDNWIKFSSKFEGYLPFMYLDVLGKVTTGMGNLIDSVSAAQALPWMKPDGTKASPNEIGAAWSLVKGRQDMKMKGGSAFEDISDLRLDDAGIQQLIQSKLDNNEAMLIKRYKGYPAWPADAQMGVHSMAWAMGPAFKFPKFDAAVNKLVPDFAEAAVQSHMNDTGNPGLIPRNAANVTLFNNAQYTLDNNLPHDVLQWAEGMVSTAASAVATVATGAAKAAMSPKGIIGAVLIFCGIGYTGYQMYKAKESKEGRISHMTNPHNSENHVEFGHTEEEV
jgi:GH24 family phage-related lysozyme (muramidase)